MKLMSLMAAVSMAGCLSPPDLKLWVDNNTIQPLELTVWVEYHPTESDGFNKSFEMSVGAGQEEDVYQTSRLHGSGTLRVTTRFANGTVITKAWEWDPGQSFNLLAIKAWSNHAEYSTGFGRDL